MSHHTNRSRKKATDLLLKTLVRLSLKIEGKKQKYLPVNYKGFVANTALEMGCTRRKIQEYLELLIESGRVELDSVKGVLELPK